MKKIAILTINDNLNYGNRLQNYATQEVLKSLRFSAVTLINTTNSDDEVDEYDVKRIETFNHFNSSYISETDYSISDQDIPYDLPDRFDFFITGSDQVWNPTFRHGSPIDFLTFAPRHKRIAYSASFGISMLPEEYCENYKLWLSEIKSLSVREETGAQIIRELTSRDAIVLIDPTLMLTKEKWLSISKAADNKPANHYLLTYFLGEKSKETETGIRTIAENNSLQIVNLLDISDEETYKTGPSEFIDYINSASIFCTDSFHGVIFSILMETPFIVFDRMGHLPSMNSRLDTLLKTFKLESRKSIKIITKEHIFKADYSHIAPILEDERKKAFDYLKEALNIAKDR